MYVIANIIYGTYKTKAVDRLINELKDIAWDEGNFKEVVGDEDEPFGYDEMYSGNSEITPGWLGVDLDQFDECAHGIDVSKLNTLPTDKQKKEAQDKFDALPQELKDIAPPIGIYIVFSTS